MMGWMDRANEEQLDTAMGAMIVVGILAMGLLALLSVHSLLRDPSWVGLVLLVLSLYVLDREVDSFRTFRAQRQGRTQGRAWGEGQR